MLLHSFINWSAWPAMGRSALQASRSLAMFHRSSAVSPVSASSCCTQVYRGRPLGRLYCVPLSSSSSVRPERTSTASFKASWAGVASGSRRTCPKIARRPLRMELRRLSRPVRSAMTVFCTKSYQRTPRMRCWHVMWNAWSFCSSDCSKVHVSAPCSRTETTRVLYNRSFVAPYTLQNDIRW